MPIPLVAYAAGAYLLGGKKLLKGGGKKLINVSSGPIASAVQGIGVGTLVNVADKKLLGGKLTSYGFPLGQTINAKPLTINGSDVATYVAINGVKPPTKGSLVTTLITIGVKKYFEAYDYIDPPTPGSIDSSNATNVTYARQQEMAPLPTYSSGGLTHN